MQHLPLHGAVRELTRPHDSQRRVRTYDLLFLVSQGSIEALQTKFVANTTHSNFST